jgi:SAM-dependent methyltransferase
MGAGFSGSYPIEAGRGEIDRLAIQSAAMIADSEHMLARIGVQAGWTCLDIGCGPGGITELMSRRAGATGRVVGIDMNEAFLAHARASAAANTEFMRADACDTGLASNSFDLAHMRFMASTSGQPERLLREAIRLVRPGGTVALQEPDVATLNCFPPHQSWDKLKAALLGAFAAVGADVHLARHLYTDVCEAGLVDVQFRPFIIGVRHCDPLVDYLPSTVQSITAAVLKHGLLGEQELSAALTECRNHLRKPGTFFTLYTVAQVWGRKP